MDSSSLKKGPTSGTPHFLFERQTRPRRSNRPTTVKETQNTHRVCFAARPALFTRFPGAFPVVQIPKPGTVFYCKSQGKRRGACGRLHGARGALVAPKSSTLTAKMGRGPQEPETTSCLPDTLTEHCCAFTFVSFDSFSFSFFSSRRPRSTPRDYNSNLEKGRAGGGGRRA